MGSLLPYILVCSLVVSCTGNSGGCNASSCAFPSLLDDFEDYCEKSHKFLDCLDKELNNTNCSEYEKNSWNSTQIEIKKIRPFVDCSGGVGLTSSLVTCLVGFACFIINRYN